jgi:hypothetical protein
MARVLPLGVEVARYLREMLLLPPARITCALFSSSLLNYFRIFWAVGTLVGWLVVSWSGIFGPWSWSSPTPTPALGFRTKYLSYQLEIHCVTGKGKIVISVQLRLFSCFNDLLSTSFSRLVQNGTGPAFPLDLDCFLSLPEWTAEERWPPPTAIRVGLRSMWHAAPRDERGGVRQARTRGLDLALLKCCNYTQNILRVRTH